MEDRYEQMLEIMLGYEFRPEAKSEKTWLLPNLVVQVGKEGLGGFWGVIREVIADGTVLVAVYNSDDGEYVVVSPSELKMIVPNIMDDVKIVGGKFRHMTGQLVDIRNEGVHGVVIFDDGTKQMEFIKMEKIGKLAYMREPATQSSDEETGLPHQEDNVHRGSRVSIATNDTLMKGRAEDYASLGKAKGESSQRDDRDHVSLQNEAENTGETMELAEGGPEGCGKAVVEFSQLKDGYDDSLRDRGTWKMDLEDAD